MIDVTGQISAVERRIGARTLPAGQARVLTIAQTYDAPVADVFDACTNPERIPRWFLPVSGDLSLGGRYQLEGNAGGTVERCDPPHGFAATWEFGGEVSWIEVRLREAGAGRTRLSWNTSRTSTTSGGPSTVRARSASAGIWRWSAWPPTSPPTARASTRPPRPSGWPRRTACASSPSPATVRRRRASRRAPQQTRHTQQATE
ncbi:SRPBCC domain-containing protein [Micromonospora tulbaghiae]|uniref:SRPBCC domain-containing protein n=1 Tax=Micromonospora tulbaghiae TaxID=479978 RepID=UPI003680794C